MSFAQQTLQSAVSLKVSNWLVSQRDTSLSDIDAIGLDFGLLTLCQHLVISYSTFGMWAGHLNSGMTIMSLGLEGMEEKVKNANLTNWHFFTDD